MSEPVRYMQRTRCYYRAQGYEISYRWAAFDSIPFNPLTKPLHDANLALITTAMPMYAAWQARQVHSEWTAEPPKKLHTAELAWDKEATHTRDLGSYFPLQLLKALVAEGRIGSLARRYHCAPTAYSQRQTREVDAAMILKACQEDAVDAALLVPL